MQQYLAMTLYEAQKNMKCKAVTQTFQEEKVSSYQINATVFCVVFFFFSFINEIQPDGMSNDYKYKATDICRRCANLMLLTSIILFDGFKKWHNYNT